MTSPSRTVLLPLVALGIPLLLLCCAAAAAAAAAEQVEDTHTQWTTLETRTTRPEQLTWTRLHRAQPDQDISLRIFLRTQHADQLLQALMQVADPSSPLYGQHWTAGQVHALVQQDHAVLQQIADYFQVPLSQVKQTPSGDILALPSMTVAKAERLLRATYHVFTHPASGTHRLSCASYSLPQHVAKHVAFIGPTVRLPVALMPKQTPHPHQKEGVGLVTPAFLKTLYNTQNYTAHSKSSLQLAGFLGQYISIGDLHTFYSKLDKDSTGRKDPAIIGHNIPSQPGIEASLDIQYGMAMAQGVQEVQFWSTQGQQPGNPGNEPWLDWLMDLNDKNLPVPASVISASYGDNENTVEHRYAERVNAEFQKLGLQGISFISASGDGGVAGSQPSLCIDFVPTFPAASPFVTAVGGTMGSNPETAATLSAGGFSNYWARPQYQKAVVEKYLKTAPNLPPSTLYNNTGAGFPDVAAQAVNFVVVVGTMETIVAGTSCASPTFAGMVALLNDVRAAAGKTPLGYLNPMLYANPDGLTDITEGNNPGCLSNGFYATAGWDPVTGLGTMNFEKMKAIVEKLA